MLEALLKLLHPFMPFLTEQVYRYMPGSEGFLMLQKWPEFRQDFVFPEEEKKMQGVMAIIRSIRNLRSEMNVAPSRKTRLMLLPAEGWTETLRGGEGYFRRLAGAAEVDILTDRAQATGKNVSAVTDAGELFIPLGDLVDFEKEIARLNKELENLNKETERIRGKLNNPGFVAKAPAQLVQGERDKLAAAETKAKSLENRIAELKDSMDAASALTLDFGKLDYISSAGLRVLLSAHKAMSKKDGMKVTNVNEIVAEVFDVTGFADILNIE